MNASLYTPRIAALRDASIGYGILPWANGPMWELQERYVFRIVYPDRDPGRLFEIPEGYQFNKASVPPLFWGFPFGYTPDGLCTVPALEHDFLCDFSTEPRWGRDQNARPARSTRARALAQSPVGGEIKTRS